uniref:Uncharacterized protein n=1 Tax=Strongyloides venezuelensis TaxID=75913 RepID=A0A0K0G5F0_STRVS
MDRKRKRNRTDILNGYLCNVQGEFKKFNYETTIENSSCRPGKTDEGIKLVTCVIESKDIPMWYLNIYPKDQTGEFKEYVSVSLKLLFPNRAKF